jgi:diadenosine tetraphosphatase ApaH/serine/threonine PP2A family protein phosphatase
MQRMKLALISDIHANHQALMACLEHARAQGATRIALLGDLVGYGGEPTAVLEQVMQEVAQGAWTVQGNHDAMAVSPPEQITHVGAQGAQWTHDQLSASQRNFLRDLPLTRQAGQVLLVHASADSPQRWHYVDNSAAAERSMSAATQIDPNIRYVFSGHVHAQALYFLTPTAKLMRFTPQPGVPVPVPPYRQWLAIVGSCGQPRDGDTRAMYALFDEMAFTLTFHRVAYDHEAAARAIRATPMPDSFAQRLQEGL